MKNAAREEEWASWMRSAIAGNSRAYHKLLTAITPHLRVIVRETLCPIRRCNERGRGRSAGSPAGYPSQAWNVGSRQALGPGFRRSCEASWSTDLRRRGRRIDIPLEDVEATLESDERLSALRPNGCRADPSEARGPATNDCSVDFDRGNQRAGNGRRPEDDRGCSPRISAPSAKGIGRGLFGGVL